MYMYVIHTDVLYVYYAHNVYYAMYNKIYIKSPRMYVCIYIKVLCILVSWTILDNTLIIQYAFAGPDACHTTT